MSKKILDIGCGEDPYPEANYGIDKYVKNVDIDNFVKADVEEGIPFPDNFFDKIYCRNLLEHLHYPRDFFKEVHRILKPEGVFKVIVPAPTIRFWDSPTHVRPYTKKSLRRLSNWCGFKVKSLELVDNSGNKVPIFFRIWKGQLRLLAKKKKELGDKSNK